jgi:CRISPR/Cas system-associated exonuclease Cas4 (RecB family)
MAKVAVSWAEAPLEIPKATLSPTQINTYLTCPLSYYRRYILGQTELRAVALALGTSGHAALAETNRCFRSEGAYLTKEDLIDAFVEDWKKEQKKVDDWAGLNAQKVEAQTRPLLAQYHDGEQDRHVPVAVEIKGRFSVAELPFFGIIDMIDEPEDGEKAIVDYKFASSGKKEADVRTSIQLGCYGMARGIRRRGFITLNKKSKKVEPVFSNVPERDTAWTERIVRDVVKAISAGVFPPVDPCSMVGRWKCTAKWCGFYDRCRGAVGRRRRKAKEEPTVQTATAVRRRRVQ